MPRVDRLRRPMACVDSGDPPTNSLRPEKLRRLPGPALARLLRLAARLVYGLAPSRPTLARARGRAQRPAGLLPRQRNPADARAGTGPRRWRSIAPPVDPQAAARAIYAALQGRAGNLAAVRQQRPAGRHPARQLRRRSRRRRGRGLTARRGIAPPQFEQGSVAAFVCSTWAPRRKSRLRARCLSQPRSAAHPRAPPPNTS